MRRFTKLTTCAVLIVGLAGCQGAGQKETLGAGVGGVLGGVLGSNVGGGSGKLAATAAGAVLGALMGSSVGQSLDRADQAEIARTSQTALETAPVGSATTWVNPDSGHSGSVTPLRTYQQADGSYCREYQQQVTVNGEVQRAYGTACRQPDGSWKIVR